MSAYVPPHRRSEKGIGTNKVTQGFVVGATVQINGRTATLWADNGDGTWDVAFKDNDEERGRVPMTQMALASGPYWTPTVFTGAKILCYGDSLTAGLHYSKGGAAFGSFAPYAESLANVVGQPCDHAGMCGWTTDQMVRRADSAFDIAFSLVYPGLRRLLKHGNYSVVLLMAGTNDIGTGLAPDTIMENLAKLHSMCHEAGARTIAVTVPQSKFASDHATLNGWLSLRSKQQTLNSLLKTYATESDGKCTYVDMESEIPWERKSPNWEPDGLHMSKVGYETFGTLLGPKIREFVS